MLKYSKMNEKCINDKNIVIIKIFFILEEINLLWKVNTMNEKWLSVIVLHNLLFIINFHLFS